MNAAIENTATGKKKKSNEPKRKAFNETLCGGPARTWAAKATLINDERWEAVLLDAFRFVVNIDDDDDVDDNDGREIDADEPIDSDPRSCVVFDW